MLKTLVINLYQTACEELANAFLRFVAADARADHLELAAQLRLTLDGAPSAANLRFFWERVGALSSGVLFGRIGPDSPLFLADRGMTEIVALATAAEAYRSCSGEYKAEQTDSRSAGDKREARAEVSIKGGDVSRTVMGLASGIAAGAAAATLLPGEAGVTVLAGALTALASMAALNYSSTRSRETTIKQEITFLPDLNVSALVHRVPLLLRRLRQAGLAPIFIVDELDKVQNVSRPLNDLASYLKFLCADQAFFCFLTDRAYIAETARINRERTNAVQRTIFTNLLFILYDTASVRAYLDRVIRPFGYQPPNAPLSVEDAAEARRYVLMHRSRMLLFELNKELEDFERNTGPSALRLSHIDQFHLMLQLAIEVVLNDQYVASRMPRDPDFGQTIFDALYYPTHRWYLGDEVIDCSAEALLEGIAALTGETPELAGADENFLYAQVKSVLDLAAAPARLKSRIRAAADAGWMYISKPVLDEIPEQPPLLVHESGDIYRWVYNRYGIPHKAGDVISIVNNPDLEIADRIIEQTASTLLEVAGRLASPSEVLAAVISAEALIDSFAALSIPDYDFFSRNSRRSHRSRNPFDYSRHAFVERARGQPSACGRIASANSAATIRSDGGGS